jgi:hypothetical protein
MWRKSTALFLFLPLMSILLLPGCATLTRNKTQRIPVTSSPTGATVFVNGIEQGVAPIQVELTRKQKGQVIRIESPGYNPAEIRLQRKMSKRKLLGNVLLGLIPAQVPTFFWAQTNSEADGYWSGIVLFELLGAAAFGGLFTYIDSGGKGYDLIPEEILVTLTKADGTPRVDTVLIDAEDFRGVKWIRVRKD